MRHFRRLALAFVLLAILAPARASSEEPSEPTAGSIELFGTSFCFVDSRLSTGCKDLATPEIQLPPPVLRPEQHARRVHFLGLTWCGAVEATGPACEVTWVWPHVYRASDDWPERRLLSALER